MERLNKHWKEYNKKQSFILYQHAKDQYDGTLGQTGI